MRLRTYLLLAVAAGTGIALFSMYADGMYSALFVAAAGFAAKAAADA